MKIDQEKLYSQYKLIQKTCLEQSIPVPFIISPYLIPDQYKYSYYELKLINTHAELLRQNEMERKRKEYAIANGKDKGTLIDLWIDELRKFLEKNPEFNNILIKQD